MQVLVAHVHVGRGGPAGVAVQARLGVGRDGGVGDGAFATQILTLVALEQRVLLELGLHEGVELNVAQLQQLDRLLQLGSDDEPLALPELQSSIERHRALLAWDLQDFVTRRPPPGG